MICDICSHSKTCKFKSKMNEYEQKLETIEKIPEIKVAVGCKHFEKIAVTCKNMGYSLDTVFNHANSGLCDMNLTIGVN